MGGGASTGNVDLDFPIRTTAIRGHLRHWWRLIRGQSLGNKMRQREEEIFVPGQSDPIVLSRRSFALRLLQYVRDEAHRFAQHYHHMLRHKRTFGEEDA